MLASGVEASTSHAETTCVVPASGQEKIDTTIASALIRDNESQMKRRRLLLAVCCARKHS